MSILKTKPFKGILFNREKIGDIGRCVCPPYDVIGDPAPYYERSPHNAIRLELPRPVPPMDEYRAAKATWDQWFQDNILMMDQGETVYVYEQEFELEGALHIRRGFIALNKLEKDRILTHEETRKKAKEDREKLIGTLKAFTSLVFGLYEDGTRDVERILVDSKKERIYDFVDEQSIRNRFFRMTSTDEIAGLMLQMEDKKIYIADGHHRLDVSYKLNLPCIPIYLTNMYSGGIVIFPYHRIVKFKQERRLSDLLPLLGPEVSATRVPLVDNASVKEVLARINSSRQPSYVLYSKDDPSGLYVLAQEAPFYDNTGAPETLRKLKVAVLHSGIAKERLNITEDEISFTQEPYEAARKVQEGLADLVLFLPSTTAQEVKDVAEHRLCMPPKSTFFYPKILTGLVFHTYA
jgi:uncharacterized protein (DUF1015 family)